MNINTGNLSFQGRYLLNGKHEQVNRAVGTISQMKGNNVEFLSIACGDNKIVIVATDDDVALLKSAKKEADLFENIKKLYKEKEGFLSKLFVMIFGSDEDALVVKEDNLRRFALPSNMINYNNGSFKNKCNVTEHYIDGTRKKYTNRGTLCELTNPDDTKEEYLNKKPQSKKPSDTQPQKREVITTQPPTCKESTKTTPAQITTSLSTPKVKPENCYPEDKPIKKISDNKSKPYYHYRGNSNEPLFIYYPDGRFESRTGTPNYSDGTISFPYKDGITEVLDKDGKIVSYIFPDGRQKNYNKEGELTEIVYPGEKTEYYNAEVKPYMVVYNDGRIEYLRKTYLNKVM